MESQSMVQEWLERRRQLGQDGRDEVWDGVYHVVPNARSEHAEVAAEVLGALRDRAKKAGLRQSTTFNLGTDDTDFRVPDAGWFRASPNTLYVPTAAAVLEVPSPDDETFRKLTFYLARGVEEVMVAHPTERWIRCWSATRLPGTTERSWTEVAESALFGTSMQALVAEVSWP